MTTSQAEIDFKLSSLQSFAAIAEPNLNFKVLNLASTVAATTKEEGKSLEKAVALGTGSYKDFTGVVHLYIRRDENENLVEWEQNGKQWSTNIIDFRNLGDAVNGWKIGFNCEGLEILPEALWGATILRHEGSYWELGCSVGNARIAQGQTLGNNPIVFNSPKINGKEPVLINFKMYAVDMTRFDGSIPHISPSRGNFNYHQALSLYPLFLEANQSGRKQSWNRVPWRGDAFLNDGQDVGKDLSGGFFDAGDHLMTAMGIGYSFSTIAVTMNFYQDVLEKIGQWQHYANNLKWAADYLMKLHEIQNGETKRFFHWIPHSKNTHNEWTPPEQAQHTRNTYTIDKNNKGSEPCFNAAACLAFTSLLFKARDPSYAAQCLYHAVILHNFARTYQGKYQSQIVYASVSGYFDEYVHSAVALYAATGDRNYLNEANQIWDAHIGGAWGWFNHLDNSSYVALFLLAKYDGNQKYHNNILGLFKQWQAGTGGIKIIDGRLRAINDWATNTQGGGMGGLFAFYSHCVQKNQGMEDFNRSQVDYILGDNPQKFSYLIGYKDKWLQSPHHRGSAGGVKMEQEGQNKFPLIGAVIGGKKLDGYFPQDGRQSRSDWVCCEVALNYNANLILATAGAAKSAG